MSLQFLEFKKWNLIIYLHWSFIMLFIWNMQCVLSWTQQNILYIKTKKWHKWYLSSIPIGKTSKNQTKWYFEDDDINLRWETIQRESQPLRLLTNTQPISQTDQMTELFSEMYGAFIVCFYGVLLSSKEFFDIQSIRDCSFTLNVYVTWYQCTVNVQDIQVITMQLNHLASFDKCLIVYSQTKWLWVWIPLESLQF